MTTHAEALKPHKKIAAYVPEGDYWQAVCGCGWRSEWFESKAEARDDHTEHVTMVLVEFHRSQS